MATIQEILDKINASKSNNINNNSFIDLMRQISGNPEDAIAPVNDTNSIYGHIVQMYTALYDNGVDYALLTASVEAIQGVFERSNVIESLYADKTKLDSIYADKIKLDQLFADKAVIDRVYGSIANIDRVHTSIDKLDTVYASVLKMDTVADNIADVNTVADNMTVLNEIYTNRDEIYAADENAAIATTKALEASNSATASATSAGAALASKNASATSEANALTYKNSASASATTATAKASEASQSEANALISKNAASVSESNAAVSESNAANSASAAAVSESTALGYKNDVSVMKLAVETLYDAFDDRFLGTKISDPIVDNDGNALLDGAMYFDTTTNAMKVYDVGTATWYSMPQIYLSALLDVEFTSISTGDILVWNGTKWSNTANTKIGSVQFEKPNTGVLFTKVSPSSFSIPIGLKVTIGSTFIETTQVNTLTLASNLVGSNKIAGTDYYVYAKEDGSFYISSIDSITTDKLIGGFHYGLVGETETLTGNKTEADMVKIRGINEYSFWDLKYRPVASPKGMVNIGKKWYDIYLLNSEHITNGTSKAGVTIAAGITEYGRAIPKIPLEYGGNNTLNYGKFTWFQACEIAKANAKRLISYSEFPTIAYGVLEGVSSSTNAYETVAGKIEHYPNLTSKYGIEQATGVQGIWGRDVGGNYPTTDLAWKDNTDSRGQTYSTSNNPTAVLLGGGRDYGVLAGSRASHWSLYVWNSNWSVGCRFTCNHLEIN